MFGLRPGLGCRGRGAGALHRGLGIPPRAAAVDGGRGPGRVRPPGGIQMDGPEETRRDEPGGAAEPLSETPGQVPAGDSCGPGADVEKLAHASCAAVGVKPAGAVAYLPGARPVLQQGVSSESDAGRPPLAPGRGSPVDGPAAAVGGRRRRRRGCRWPAESRAAVRADQGRRGGAARRPPCPPARADARPAGAPTDAACLAPALPIRALSSAWATAPAGTPPAAGGIDAPRPAMEAVMTACPYTTAGAGSAAAG